VEQIAIEQQDSIFDPGLRKQITDAWRAVSRPAEETELPSRSIMDNEGEGSLGWLLGRIPRKLIIDPAREALQAVDTMMNNPQLYYPGATKEQQELGGYLMADAMSNFIGGGSAGKTALNIGRPAAKKAIWQSLCDYWAGLGKEELKQKFKPYREALDAIPQKDLDAVNVLRTEKSFGELFKLHPEWKGGELYGLHITNNSAKDLGDIFLNANLPSDLSPLEVLLHEMAHAVTINPAGVKNLPTKEKLYSTIMNAVARNKEKELTYGTNPREVLAKAKAAAQEKLLQAEGLVGKGRVDEEILEAISSKAAVQANEEMIKRLVYDKPHIASPVTKVLKTFKEPETEEMVKDIEKYFQRGYGKSSRAYWSKPKRKVSFSGGP